MEEIGQVVEIAEDQIVVLLGASTNCDNCNSCSELSNNKMKTLSLSNTINAKLNDLIILSLSESKSIFISVLLYVFPLIMMIIGYFVGVQFENRDPNISGDSFLAIFFSTLFLIISFLLIYYIDKWIGRKHRLSPKLIGFYSKIEHPNMN